MATNTNHNPEPFERQMAVVFIIVMGLLLFFCSCSPRVVERVVTQIEYRDRVVHDTATVEIPYEVEKIVTRDTVSHLENSFARSDASVSGGFLSHSLETIPHYIQVPVEVHVTDTLIKEAEIKEITREIEKPLSWWQSFKLRSFCVLLAAVACLLLWTFRKLIF